MKGLLRRCRKWWLFNKGMVIRIQLGRKEIERNREEKGEKVLITNEIV
jgi:hypothetical protein